MFFPFFFFYFLPRPETPQKITRTRPQLSKGKVGLKVSNVVPRCPAGGTDSYTQAGVCIEFGEHVFVLVTALGRKEAHHIASNIPL